MFNIKFAISIIIGATVWIASINIAHKIETPQQDPSNTTVQLKE